MAKKIKKKTGKFYSLLMVIKQNKLLFTIYSVAVFLILIIMDYWAGFFKLSLGLTPFIDNNIQYLHFLPFINLNLNSVAINFNGYASISNLTWGGVAIYCLSMILTSLIIGLLLTLLTIKLEKKFSSKKKPFILIFIPFFALSLSAAGLSANIKSNNISWAPKKITQTVFTGTTKILNAQFVANEDLEDMSLEATAGLKKFLTIIPNSFQKIKKNQITEIKFLVSVPANTEVNDYGGTIHIKSADKPKRTYPQTLKVNLSVEEPVFSTIPEGLTMISSDLIKEDIDSGNKFVDNELIIAFQPEISKDTIKNVVNNIGGTFLGSDQDLNWYQVRVGVSNATALDALINQLEAYPEVKFAERHWFAEEMRYPTDPGYYPDEWDEEHPEGKNWGQEFIKLLSAWDINTGSKDIKISIIDEGFDAKHIDLEHEIYYIAPDNLISEHGTHIAGIIGAEANNESGIAGLMWNSSLLLLPTQPLDIPLFVLLAKVAIQKDVKLINLSSGIEPRFPLSLFIKKYNKYFIDLMDWLNNQNRDVLLIVAAGNKHRNVKYTSPASLSEEYDNVISVAAIDENGNLADEETWGSNYGNVTVVAPGVNIYSTLPDNQYGYKSGTSMAAPFVSGLAGLIWSRAEELGKTLTAAEVKQLIIDGAVKGEKFAEDPDGNQIPIINAYESLKLLDPAPPPPPTAKAPWSTLGYDGTRSGQSIYNGPATNNIKWTYTATSTWGSPYFGIAPVVGQDNTIYVGNEAEGKLYALNSNGTVKWIFSDNSSSLGTHLSAPVISDTGIIYIGTSAGILYAINSDGTEKWHYTLDTRHWVGTPVVDENGDIYFTSTFSSVDNKPNYLYAINSDGTEKWKYQIENFSGIAHTAIGPDGTIYSSSIYTYSHNDLLYAVLPNGKLKWKKYYRPGTSPVVGPDGTIYFKNVYLGLEAVNPDDGSLKWFNRLHPKLKPSVSKNNIIIVDDSTGLYALNSDGTEKWKNDQIGSIYNSSATIGDDGTVYIATNLGLFALDINDGSIKWKIDGISATSPAIGTNGTLYAGWNYNIYAIGG